MENLIKKSTRKDKKYMYTGGDKVVHFGARDMSDFTKHGDS